MIRSTFWMLLLCGCDSLLGVHDIVPMPLEAGAASPPTLTFTVTPVVDLPSADFQVVDINADGKPDVFTATQFLVNTTEPGSAPTFTPSPFSLVTGPTVGFVDLNADDKPDLFDLHSNGDPDTVGVFADLTPVGSGAVSFGARATVIGTVGSAGSDSSVAFGDVDGDGKVDMLEFHPSSTVSVYVNTTTLGAASPTFASRVDLSSGVSSINPLLVELHDLNGDGKLDVIEMVFDDHGSGFTNAAIMLNTSHLGDPSFQIAAGIPDLSECSQFGFADLDGDGFVDIVAACGTSIRILHNTTSAIGGVPTFAPPIGLLTAGTVTHGLLITDLDGDGKPDIVLEPNGLDLEVSFNTSTAGTIGFLEPVVFAALEVAGPFFGVDVNGDGRNDILTTVITIASVELDVLTISTASP